MQVPDINTLHTALLASGFIDFDENPQLNTADFNCFGKDLQVAFRDKSDKSKFYELDRIESLLDQRQHCQEYIDAGKYRFAVELGSDQWTVWELSVNHY